MDQDPIRLFLVDDHVLLLDALERMFRDERDVAVIGRAEGGRAALDRIPLALPDVVVVDLLMPDVSGIEVTRVLRNTHPGIEVVVLAGQHNEAWQRQAFEAGARAWILKKAPFTRLLEGVRAAARGDWYISTAGSSDAVADYVASLLARGKPGGVMTRREREIAVLLADGYSTKEAAAVLGISPKTAETHRASIMRKIGARNVTDIVRYCIRNRLIEP